MTLRATILDEIRTVADNQKKALAPLTDDLSLNDFGARLALLRDTRCAPRGYHRPRSAWLGVTGRTFRARSASSLPFMTKPLPETPSLGGLIEGGAGRGRVIATRDYVLPLDGFAQASSLGSHLARFQGRSVVLSVRDMAKAAAALIDLDGCAGRILLCPPGWEPWRLELAARGAEVDALVYDDAFAAPHIPVEFAAPCRLPLQPLNSRHPVSRETEWILPTSGTSGPPKLVAHTLRTLVGAIAEAPLQQWATFYDIRRYGGLQIFLRALSGKGSLHLRAGGKMSAPSWRGSAPWGVTQSLARHHTGAKF